MDNFSLLQIIERIPEFRFKYMGCYRSDKLPQLTKYILQMLAQAVVAIVNSWIIEGSTES